ncbi:alpha/beta hydrolase [Roseomonas populi]|uniref:Alpha/beta hydrolase n=1 Tax=Roseomonas populi TaxID=3121582 RepID=A0ABT1XE88_9PROT|nr:alpha/beta hydrolase [Roseomonas pecuniae]MCR0985294.1 alpha/beta hydrolase [Roseomonas pecuniae]
MPITVQFATNRRLTGPGEALSSYGNNVVTPSSPAEITYGTAFVDEVNLTADTVGAITSIGSLRQGGFSDEAIGDLAGAGRNLLIFVHGFDNSFENAITRAAFNREWLAASGLEEADTSVVAFSWPSAGRLLAFPLLWEPYKSDQVMAGQSGLHLMSFFANLEPIVTAARADGRRVFLLAHSMGNYVLQSAVENWFSHGNGDAALFDEAFLAAADEQYRSFDLPHMGRLSGLGRLAQRITILFSEADNVLGVSAALNLVRRLGQEGPHARFDQARFPPARYSMVDCAAHRDFDFGFASSHQYYRRSRAVRSIIASAMARPQAI